MKNLRFGWIKEPYDPRDYTEENLIVKKPQFKLPFFKDKGEVNHDKFVVKGKDQLTLNSCISFGVRNAIGFSQMKKYGNFEDISCLDEYWTLRFLMYRFPPTEDEGGYIRDGIWAARHGVLPEIFWPYDVDNVNVIPPNHLLRFADEYKIITTIKLDAPKTPRERTFQLIKKYCENACPVVFGAYLGESYYQSFNGYKSFIQLPNLYKESIVGGHCMMIPAGFSDKKKAFRLQNSHKDWGDEKMLGWIDYNYFTKRQKGLWLASDIWAVVDVDCLLTGQFK